MSRLYTKRNNKKEYLVYCCNYYEGYHFGTGISPDGGEPFTKFKTRLGTINYTKYMKMNFFDTKEEALIYMYETEVRLKSRDKPEINFQIGSYRGYKERGTYCDRYPYGMKYIEKLMYEKYPHFLI